MSAKLSAQALSMSFQVYLPDLAAAIIKQSEMSRDLWGTYVGMKDLVRKIQCLSILADLRDVFPCTSGLSS
jgi:hypothetical protein